ncbi:MAG: DUF456 domain-containing protein [Chitinophagales bacterium]
MEITVSVLVYLLIVVLAVSGIVFSILPPIPGPLLSLGAMFSLHYWLPNRAFENPNLLWIMTAVTITVLVVENLMPIYLTKKFGGSKQGIWGSTIGLLVGLFFLPANIIFPFNLILGLFVGAMIGEFIAGKDTKTAFKSGFGSFIGFLAGNGLKLAVAIIMTVQMIQAIF